MKRDLTLSVFHLCLGLCLIISAPLAVKSQIYSAPGGGVWNSPSTWMGGIVPSSSDNVFITSTVFVNGNACNNMSIESGGVLQNSNTNSYLMTVNGNLANNGTISNNAGYALSLNVAGNISNTGIMSYYSLTLTGSGNQQIASTQPISVANLTKNNTSGRAIATTGLSFVGTNINLNADTLQFTSGNSIAMDGGNFSSGVFYKSSMPALQITSGNGTYSYLMTIDALQLAINGELLIYSSSHFKNNVINNGILQNSPTNNYTLTISGNFTNNGTVQNNFYSLSVNISGNLINNGTWTNQTTTLNGNRTQEISMTQPFQGPSLVRNSSAGRVRAITGLVFIGTDISLNSDTLEFTTGNSISLSGGSLNSGVLYKSDLPALELTTNNGAYLYIMSVNAPQVNLYGEILIYSTNSIKGQTVNYGTLQNSPQNSYSLNITGNFINHGTVQNNSYYLYLNISGNLANNGTWTNFSTTLNGNGNQELSMTEPFGCSRLTRNTAAGRVKAITDISFIGTEITINDTLEFTTGNSIALNGGYISSGVIYKTALPTLKITTENGAYLYVMNVNATQVELYGTLLIYSTNTFKGHIINYGTLQNSPYNSYTLNITGNFVNNGTVQNNSYYLYLNISGNLANNGIWTNYFTTLNGQGSQELSMTQPFGCLNLTRNTASGRIKALSDLSFIGTSIILNDTLEFTTGNSIAISGGSISSGVLFKSALPALKITTGNGTYFSVMYINAPQVELYGSLLFYSTNNFIGNVFNYGTLQNSPFNSYILNVAGNFSNNGTVKNNVYFMYLNISGDVTNNGSWENYQTTLTGTNTHFVAFSNRFEGGYLTNGNGTGSIIATTDLIFDGTTIDLNNCSFTLGNGSHLSVLNGSLSNTVIWGSDIYFHSLSAYCVGVVFNSDVTLKGVVQIGYGVGFNGSIINDGVLKNRNVSSYGILVQGDIHNNGAITDNVYGFTVTVLGNIYNSGVWSNFATILDGASDQYIYLINNRQIQSGIRLDANFSGSGFTWWGPSGVLTGNSNFSGASSQILQFLNPVTGEFLGQYHCVNTQSVSSRNIFINSQVRSALDITVLLEGLYDDSGLMQPAMDASGNRVWSADIADQITIELHDINNFSTVVVSVPEVLLYTDGSAYAIIPAGYTGSYYLAIKHRNSIETASATPVSISNSEGEYDFDIDTKAFGNNLKLMSDGWYAIYGGDVLQDGFIDTGDMTMLDNDAYYFLNGYLVSDVNGDGFTDTADMTIVDNNAANFVTAITP